MNIKVRFTLKFKLILILALKELLSTGPLNQITTWIIACTVIASGAKPQQNTALVV